MVDGDANEMLIKRFGLKFTLKTGRKWQVVVQKNDRKGQVLLY